MQWRTTSNTLACMRRISTRQTRVPAPKGVSSLAPRGGYAAAPRGDYTAVPRGGYAAGPPVGFHAGPRGGYAAGSPGGFYAGPPAGYPGPLVPCLHISRVGLAARVWQPRVTGPRRPTLDTSSHESMLLDTMPLLHVRPNHTATRQVGVPL